MNLKTVLLCQNDLSVNDVRKAPRTRLYAVEPCCTECTYTRAADAYRVLNALP